MSGMVRWSSAQVEALAPDAASVAAGRKLAVGSGWSGLGCTDQALWGLCQGSGKTPYRAIVDLSGPAYSCSCPSRKFPCKHALGLLLRWSAGSVPDTAGPADFAQAWLATRAERAEQASAREQARAQASTAREADPEAAAKRARARVAKVTAGLTELERWLGDQVRAGLAGLPAKGYAAFEPMAARLVDAQAPGIAAWLRGLPAVVAGGGLWPQRLLEELALLQLLVHAHRRLDEFDLHAMEFAATVRQHIGYPVAKESVLARPPVTDAWSVWAVRDSEAGNLQQRTVWVQGRDSGRMAVVLSFAAAGQLLDASLVAGTAFEGALHFYPGSRPSRALVGEHAAPGRPAYPNAGLATAACDAVAATLAADPWARDTAVWVGGVPVRAAAGWVLADEVGDTLPLRGVDAELWRLVATCGGRRLPVLLDWSPLGWAPLTVAAPEGLVPLTGSVG
jgi:hypothetical protein